MPKEKRKKIRLIRPLLLLALITFIIYLFINKPEIESKSAILIDAETGEILFQKDADSPFSTASTTKLMTTYLLLENIQNGHLNWDDETTILPATNDFAPGTALVELPTWSNQKIEVLYQAMLLNSANNATRAIAEKISGSETQFTQLMNEKARALHLSDQTNYLNATGLALEDGRENKMTANDLALLASLLIKDYPNVLETTQQSTINLTAPKLTLTNTNLMLNQSEENLYMPEVDGLKTGFTDSAGYCFVGTASKDNKRFIVVILGSKNERMRFAEAKQLFNYGFKQNSFTSLWLSLKNKF